MRREWVQFFDLGHTTLVCRVDGENLQLNLLHWTDEAFKNCKATLNQDPLRLFNHSENNMKDTLKEKFEKYKSAKLIFDGKIVPQVQLKDNTA